MNVDPSHWLQLFKKTKKAYSVYKAWTWTHLTGHTCLFFKAYKAYKAWMWTHLTGHICFLKTHKEHEHGPISLAMLYTAVAICCSLTQTWTVSTLSVCGPKGVASSLFFHGAKDNLWWYFVSTETIQSIRNGAGNVPERNGECAVSAGGPKGVVSSLFFFHGARYNLMVLYVHRKTYGLLGMG